MLKSLIDQFVVLNYEETKIMQNNQMSSKEKRVNLINLKNTLNSCYQQIVRLIETSSDSSLRDVQSYVASKYKNLTSSVTQKDSAEYIRNIMEYVSYYQYFERELENKLTTTRSL